MAISTHIRKKIADFDPVRDGITVKQFCKDNGISKQSYFNIKNRINQRGRAGIVADSTAPKNPARLYSQELSDSVIQARHSLKAAGRDYGPWSIYYYLIDELGCQHPPSRSTIARWLHDAGLVNHNARKRPRKSYRRFARSHVNELWQIDAFTYRLFDESHTQITVYQVLDDASRFDVGSQAFHRSENGTDARITLAVAMKKYGRCCEILSDNGEAFATYHRGRLSDTEVWLAQQGVRASAGFAPTTQGKDERSHQTMTKFLDARKPTTLVEVISLIEEYRTFYNTVRRHQSLLIGKMHITPAQAWQNFPRADSPTTPIDPDEVWAKITRSPSPARKKPDRGNDDDISATKGKIVPGEVAATPGTTVNDSKKIQQDLHPIADPTVACDRATSKTSWDIPKTLRIKKNGTVRVADHSLYVGQRFKNRSLYSNITNNHAEFFTEHDGELLFSFPLPIRLYYRPAGNLININYVIGMWHRQPPVLSPALSKPRPKRYK